VGRAFLPAAAFQAAFSTRRTQQVPAESRLQRVLGMSSS